MSKAKFTPGPWRRVSIKGGWDGIEETGGLAICSLNFNNDANAALIAAAPTQHEALNYVADMTYCGADGEWHFKVGYDPQVVLDAIARAVE